jgi:hypothetical protein
VKFKFFLFCFVLSAFFVCNASGSGENKEKLGGLVEVGVFIEVEGPHQEFQAINEDQLQTYVETRLRQAGIKVAARTNVETRPELSFIYLNVTVRKLETLYAYSTDLMCLIPSPKKEKTSHFPTWTMRRSGLTAEVFEVREKVVDLVNNFIKDYASANRHTQIRRTTTF